MESDLREEIEWLEHKIETLEEHIETLERENFHLKSLIGRTIVSLEQQNQETKKIIYGHENKGAIRKDSESFTPYNARNKNKNVEGIVNAVKMIEILQARLGLQRRAEKKITRLKLIRIVQDYAKLIAFEAGHKDFKDADYAGLTEVKNFIDQKWLDLD